MHTPIYLKAFSFCPKDTFSFEISKVPPPFYYFGQYVLLFSKTFRSVGGVGEIIGFNGQAIWETAPVLYHISYPIFLHSVMPLFGRKLALLSLGVRIDQNLLLCNNDPLLDGVFHAWQSSSKWTFFPWSLLHS